jgi:hypothetical protein
MTAERAGDMLRGWAPVLVAIIGAGISSYTGVRVAIADIRADIRVEQTMRALNDDAIRGRLEVVERELGIGDRRVRQ